MSIHHRIAWFVLLLPLMGHAGTSANYTLAPDSLDNGGQRGSSASYALNPSATSGGHGTSSDYTTRTGFAGQLSDAIATAIDITASPLTLNEGGTRQLIATLIFDDLTTTPIAATSITWGVQSGPLAGVNASGLAIASTVYQDTGAVVQGACQTFTDTLNLTVLNTSADNFGAYAGDALDDAWQVQYFGLDNPNAAPAFDPDGDGQANHFEFTAGLDPTSNASHFLQSISHVPGQPGQKNITISPRLSDRTYTVLTSPTLGATATWTDLTTFTVSDIGPTRTITDTSATGPRKFYLVEIVKP